MPLICHTVRQAVRIRDASDGLFGAVLVAADDRTVVDAVAEMDAKHGWGVQAVMTDPGHQSGSDRIAEAAAALPPSVDAILNLQGDEPDVPPQAVLELAAFFRAGQSAIATMVYPVTDEADRRNPALVKAVLGEGGRALYFSRADVPFRRDDGPFAPPSYGHVGIYLYDRRALERFVALPAGRLEQTEKLEQLRALENGIAIGCLVLAERPPKGIDTSEDYADFVARCRAGGEDVRP